MTESSVAMDMELIPIIDVNNLAWRSIFGTGVKLSHGETETTIAYGLFMAIERLQRLFFASLDNFIFAFDHPPLLRKKAFPAYKSKRKAREANDPVAQERRLAVTQQVKAFRYELLPAMGFNRILGEKGFEADDIIAQACIDLSDERVMIVSNDKDLYQCLSKTHFVWNGEATMTRKKFKAAYGVRPNQWPLVKAIGGCLSDDIPGIKGVGELTALRHIRGEVLKPAKARAIDAGGAAIDEYLKLTTLPYRPMDLGLSDMEPNRVTPKQVKRVFRDLGIQSITFSY